MNIYDKFLECSPEHDMFKAKGASISYPYYEFLKDKAEKYYELKAQQQEIQYDEEVVLKTAEELFGKGVITGVFSIHNGTHTYCNLNLGKTYLMSECEKSWFENIPEILIKSRRKIADPSTLPIDAHIQVKVDGMWKDRHFARFENGEVYIWVDGRTSKTTRCCEIATTWRLPEEGE